MASTSLALTHAPRSQPSKATAKMVPAFLNKLFSMVNDPATDDLIRWSDDGDSFFVPSADKFGRELLPRFFKHSNFGSFVRQLNMYGFHKVPHLQQGVLKTDSDEASELLEFSNPHFTRDQPDLLCLIKRQKSKADSHVATNAPDSSLDIPNLLSDLQAVRKHQTALSSELKNLQTSNHALWQEAFSWKEKHKQQQQTIDKILRFLGSVFGGQIAKPTETPTSQADEPLMRRPYQLLLEDRDRTKQTSKIIESEDGIEEIKRSNLMSPISSMQIPNRKEPAIQDSSRFISLGSSGGSPAPDFHSDYLNNFLNASASSNSSDLDMLLSNSSVPTSTTADSPNFSYANLHPGIDFSRALLPASSLSPSLYYPPVSNDLSTLSNPGALFPLANQDLSMPDQLASDLNSNKEQLDAITAEKQRIDQRAAAVEDAVAKLMASLPPETQAQLMQGKNDQASATASTPEPNVNWNATPPTDADIETLLAQYVNSNGNNGTAQHEDEEEWEPFAFESGTAGLPGVVKSTTTNKMTDSDASFEAGQSDDDFEPKGIRRGRKRKSESLLDEDVLETTRRSSRRKK